MDQENQIPRSIIDEKKEETVKLEGVKEVPLLEQLKNRWNQGEREKNSAVGLSAHDHDIKLHETKR